MKAILSVVVFTVAYYFIATEKVNKTIVAVIGAALVIFLKLATFEQAIAAVDFNVIFLLVGMMTCVYVLSKTGFFEWSAIAVARFARGSPLLIVLLLLAMTAVLSAFLDNVTTIILIAPVTILIMQLLEVNPAPAVILEAIASNIGGTATLIGDPPNMVIGSQAHLSFNDFLIGLGPVITLVFLVFILTVLWIFRSRFRTRESYKRRVLDAIPHLAITDKGNMIRALVILGGIFIGFFLHDWLNVEAGVVALCGSMVMLLVCRFESEAALMRVEWGVIFFFIGMFMVIAALDVNGVIPWIGEKIIRVAGGNMFLLCLAVLWGSAVFSAIMDNIPFVIAMVPLIRHFVNHFSLTHAGSLSVADIHAQIAQPLWWALALGACLGGNGTLIGASANIVMARIGEKNNCPVTFRDFFRYGFPFMIQTVLVASVYIWFRYFFK